jgi:hypothetical protein
MVSYIGGLLSARCLVLCLLCVSVLLAFRSALGLDARIVGSRVDLATRHTFIKGSALALGSGVPATSLIHSDALQMHKIEGYASAVQHR